MVENPTVAVYMVCKDEVKLIRRAVESALEADDIVVCDTGSTDGTVELLKGVDRIRLFQLSIAPWRFDDARNAALSLVSSNVSYCVSLDADEVLAPGFIQQLRTYLDGHRPTRINHSFETHWNWESLEAPDVSRHFHERIHQRHGYRWVHPVHEKLVCQGPEHVGWCEDLLIRQLPDLSKPRTSYLPLLEQAVLEDPGDWKLWAFLYGERTAANDARAVEALNEALKLPGSDKAYLHMRQGEFYERSGNVHAATAAFTLACSETDVREVFLARAE
ncbi:MAG: glycosyltransferase, partial [Chloroflexi bacterium]|nr:glycosyltransferase [Chloroflexota bacterium]